MSNRSRAAMACVFRAWGFRRTLAPCPGRTTPGHSRRMRAFLLPLLPLLGLCAQSHAQALPLVGVKSYAEAAVLLATGAVRTGHLRFYYHLDVIALTSANDSTDLLPAERVRGFAARDAAAAQAPGDAFVALERVFRTFPLPAAQRSPTGWGFYEQLSQGPGPVLLLRRQEATVDRVIVPARPSTARLPAGRPAAGSRVVDRPGVPAVALYLATATGPVVALRRPGHVLRHFPRHKQALRAYARENELRYADNLRDLAFLVDHANTLSLTRESTP